MISYVLNVEKFWNSAQIYSSSASIMFVSMQPYPVELTNETNTDLSTKWGATVTNSVKQLNLSVQMHTCVYGSLLSNDT